MAITSKFLRDIEAEARPIIERQMNDAKIIAGLRDVVAAAGGDWGALKALIKARVEDDNDESGEGKRVRKIREKADCIVAYDDMLGSNMNEKNFSAASYAEAKGGEHKIIDRIDSDGNRITVTVDDRIAEILGRVPHDPETGELTDTQEQPETATSSQHAGNTAKASAAGVSSAENDSDEISAPLSPSPETPQATADEEASPPAKSSATLSNPQPILLPGAGKAGDVPPPSSPAALSDAEIPAFLRKEEKKDCLKLKDGHCKISFDTPALCSVCNAERMKARAA